MTPTNGGLWELWPLGRSFLVKTMSILEMTRDPKRTYWCFWLWITPNLIYQTFENRWALPSLWLATTSFPYLPVPTSQCEMPFPSPVSTNLPSPRSCPTLTSFSAPFLSNSIPTEITKDRTEQEASRSSAITPSFGWGGKGHLLAQRPTGCGGQSQVGKPGLQILCLVLFPSHLSASGCSISGAPASVNKSFLCTRKWVGTCIVFIPFMRTLPSPAGL